MAGIIFLAACFLFCPSPLSLILAIAVHEAGHAVCALIFGWKVPTVSFSTAGIRLSYHGSHPPLQSIVVSLGGSFFGIAAALLPFGARAFRLYSLGFAAVNLLPVSALDGGGALISILELLMLPDRAYKVSRAVSCVTVLLLWAAAIAAELKIGANLSLLALTVYLTVTALTE